MRNTYLIDFENVGSDGLAGVTALTSEDRVIIFYSANSCRMTLRAHQQIVASEAQFDYFEVSVGGKNALDHQLGTYLGYLVAINASERYFIVSHDNGFKFLSAFWLARNSTLQISLVDNIKISLRTRSTDRTRVSQTVRPMEATPHPVTAPVTGFAAGMPAAEPTPSVTVPELHDVPATIPVAKPSPMVEIPAQGPAPVVEILAQERVSAVETPVEESIPVVETPVVDPQPAFDSSAVLQPDFVAEEPATQPALPASPMPALGSQSRSRNTHRSRIRSESILATLSAAHAGAPLVAVETDFKPETEPATIPVAEPAAEPAPIEMEAAPVTEPVPIETEPTLTTEPAPQETDIPVVEPALSPAESKPDVRRNRSRRGRSRQNALSQRPANSKAAEQQPAESEAKAETKSDSNQETKTEQKPDAKEKPKREQKPDAKTESKREQRPDVKAEAKHEQKPEAVELKAEIVEAVNTLLQPFPKVSETRVRELIAMSKKQMLCNMLRRQLGQEQGLALYNQIKRVTWK